ncbi:hypothetical protein [Paenibacillus sp. IHBB 3054]|uniref:hypothetical protein n=1 Tax=Paenibacillus sp. IHBB 3054 TaxID=3425689 RepID=UPI003F6722D1
MERPIGIIVSELGPLAGQGSCSSGGNFSNEWFGGAHRMLVEEVVPASLTPPAK